MGTWTQPASIDPGSFIGVTVVVLKSMAEFPTRRDEAPAKGAGDKLAPASPPASDFSTDTRGAWRVGGCRKRRFRRVVETLRRGKWRCLRPGRPHRVSPTWRRRSSTSGCDERLPQRQGSRSLRREACSPTLVRTFARRCARTTCRSASRARESGPRAVVKGAAVRSSMRTREGTALPRRGRTNASG